MAYPKEHKARTRARIVAAARRLFKRHGFEGVGIDTIMGETGLTRGGFYAHFGSKEELFREVFTDTTFLGKLRAYTDENGVRSADEPEDYIEQAIDGYLGDWQLKDSDAACFMPTLSADARRASRWTRDTYTRAIKATAEEFEKRMGRDDLAGDLPADIRGTAALAMCVGGLTLARAVNDKAFAKHLLDACKAAAKMMVADDAHGPEPGRKR